MSLDTADPQEEIVLRAGDDELRIWMPRPNIFCTRARGNLRYSLAVDLMARMDALLSEAPPVHSFHDWADMSRYDTEARTKLTAYVDARKQCYASSHILVRSRMLAMGINIANILLKNHIQAYGQRGVFEQALHRAMALPHYGQVA